MENFGKMVQKRNNYYVVYTTEDRRIKIQGEVVSLHHVITISVLES